jgi:membrane-bound serine protease (ClpP class)
MLLASFWTEFVNLFTQMHWIVILLLGLGLVLCLVEAFVPGFGFFGITGILCEIAGVIVHAVFSGSVLQVFCLILVIALLVVVLFLIFIRSAKYGLLAKSAIVENKTALPKDFREKAEDELRVLLGKEGLTLTECKPVGKIRIGQDTYEAQSIGVVIPKGDVIKVVSIEDARIMIDKLSY